MNKLVIGLLAIMLSGCFATTKTVFPDYPQRLMTEPRQMTPLASALPEQFGDNTPNTAQSNLPLDKAAAIIADNYVKATLNAAQLKELQQWILDQHRIYNTKY